MRRNWLIVLLLLSVGVNLGLGLGMLRDRGADEVQAPSPPPPVEHVEGETAGHGDRAARLMRGRLDHMARALDLAPVQQESLWALHEGMSERFFAARGRRGDLRRRMHTALTAPDASWERVRALLDEQADLQAELDSLVVRIMFEERRILTPEQLARYHEFVFPFGGREGPGAGRRFGRPGHEGRRGAPRR
jgi:Spy/CpxP family protein refolding chaperone